MWKSVGQCRVDITGSGLHYYTTISLEDEFYDILQREKDLGLVFILAFYDLLRN